jgi:hypothetical protein
MRQLTEKARTYLRQAEHCYRLAQACPDRHRSADLNVLGDEFLNKAARADSDPTELPMRGSAEPDGAAEPRVRH